MPINYKLVQNLLRLIVIISALVLVVFILISKGSSANSSSTALTQTSNGAVINNVNPSNPYAILSPATVASKVAECSQPVNYNSSGVPAPLQCSNGDLNVTAWNALSAQEPKVMSLGYDPSVSALQSAFCSDLNAAASDSAPGADNGIETAVFQISSLYYGWSFGSANQFIANC